MLYQLVVLGEAAKAALQADPSLAARFPAVPWSSMARVRDRAAHHYYKLDRDVVWDTSRTAVPAAAAAVQVALRALARGDMAEMPRPSVDETAGHGPETPKATRSS